MANKRSGSVETVYQTEAQWTADQSVYGADVVAVTIGGANDGKHKLFKGTGRWTTLTYVEDAVAGSVISVNTQTGAVVLDAGDIDITPYITVTAGTGSGTYRNNGNTQEGAPIYEKVGDITSYINLQAGAWEFIVGNILKYQGLSGGATPAGVTWETRNGATEPLPVLVFHDGTTVQLDLEQNAEENADNSAAIAAVSNEVVAGIYEAALTQVGSAAPTAVVFVNTTGRTVTWSRDEAGSYTGTFSVPCVVASSGVMLGSPTPQDRIIAPAFLTYALNTGSVQVYTVTMPADGATDVTLTGADDQLTSTIIRLVLRNS